MSPVWTGIFGAAVALLVVLLGNIILLPWVLGQQNKAFDRGWKVPFLGWNQEKTALMTRFTYRYIMPILFTFLGFVIGTTFGGTR